MAIIYKFAETIDYSKAGRKEIVNFLYAAAFKFLRIDRAREEAISFKEVHLSPQLRCDILHLAINDKVTIIELKTCKEDFKVDSKWTGYLDYCDYFYFMCPENVISTKDIPKNVGLIHISKNGLYSVEQRPYKLRPKMLNHAWFSTIYKRLAFRKHSKIKDQLIPLDEENLFIK